MRSEGIMDKVGAGTSHMPCSNSSRGFCVTYLVLSRMFYSHNFLVFPNSTLQTVEVWCVHKFIVNESRA